MDGDTTQGERLKQEGLGGSGSPSKLPTLGTEGEQEPGGQTEGKSREVSEDGSGLEGRRQE